MKRIMIIGNAGAGKSTLAKELGSRLKIEVCHLDRFFWGPNWIPVEKEHFIEMHDEIMVRDSWIIDGNYSATFERRIQASDLIIFLDYPTIHCMYGIIKRRILFQGKTRPDIGEGCREKLDWEFIRWVAGFRKKRRPAILRKLENAAPGKVCILHSRKEAEELVTKLLPNI